MQTIYELVTLECQNEHDLEYGQEHKTQFSTPKIFDANGNLDKRWYVYFSFRNPKTGKLQRMKNIYGGANRFKTKAERYSILNLYKKRLLHFLERGYSPFGDNTELHQKYTNKNNDGNHKTVSLQPNPQPKDKLVASGEDTSKSKKRPKTVDEQPHQPNQQPHRLKVKDALDKAIELKTNVVSPTTLADYKSRVNKLLEWLKNNHKEVTTIDQATKKIMVEFLNDIQLKTSARNRNNYRTVFSSLFQVLEDNELIEKNFIPQIRALKTRPKRHKTYSTKEQMEIFDYLEKNDNTLLLFIKFISYNFLRPIEVCRLRVRDINVEEKRIRFQAKNKPLKTNIIPDILLEELPDLSKLDGDLLLFTPNGIGGEWDASLVNRRDHFSKRFKTVVKDRFGFNENYGMYSFRHTFITKLYRLKVKESSPFQAKSELMQITGHSTMSSLEKYLRDIDAELPEDYSEYLKND